MEQTRLDDDIRNVIDLLSNIKRIQSQNIDDKVLSCIIQFFYRCGMLKKEVSITNIGDIIYQGKKIQELIPGSFDNPSSVRGNSIPLNNFIIGILKNYIQDAENTANLEGWENCTVPIEPPYRWYSDVRDILDAELSCWMYTTNFRMVITPSGNVNVTVVYDPPVFEGPDCP